MAPIKIGFVGLSSRGWASTNLAPPLLKSPLSDQYTLTAVSTSSAESARVSAEKYGGLFSRPVKPYHGSTEAIANDPDVDLVAVSVKTPQHKAALIPAIAAGKDVFVEWPLGRNLQESIELAEAAKQKGVRTLIGLQSWQTPLTNKVKEWVSSGKIGRVLSVNWIGAKPAEIPIWVPFHSRSPGDGDYGLDPNNGATFLSIPVGHSLSNIIYALGPVSSVSATSTQLFKETKFVGADNQPTGETMPSLTPDQWAFTGIMRDSGAILTASWRTGGTATKETDKARPTLVWLIEGEEGHIRVESTHLFGAVPQVAATHKVILNCEEVAITDHELGNTGLAWLEFAKGEKGNYPTFDDAVDLYKHLDAIERSAKEGRRVNVDI
ncbi:hypothetical protein EWM64_g6826 [Hericium alpestre]|uniref:Uncharacterized protein n=1 Tax=Hericium alpestre TaxID=135208 RepID=A0A4Y9ZT23_9AGAM|nr:hypothetical protein EWM64_g6826 [Hericium alpestre]